MNSNWFKLLMKMTKVEYGKNLLLKGMPVIFNKGGAKLKIGKNVTIKSSFLSNLVGLYSRTIIVTRALGAVIEIGDNVGISGATIYARKGIYIGENTCIGGNCKILDNDFHPIEVEARNQLLRDSKGGDSDLVPSKEIRIGKNCFLGCNSIVLKGTVLGDGCVVGAGAVVSGKFEENCVIAGNPAKRKREWKRVRSRKIGKWFATAFLYIVIFCLVEQMMGTIEESFLATTVNIKLNGIVSAILDTLCFGLLGSWVSEKFGLVDVLESVKNLGTGIKDIYRIHSAPKQIAYRRDGLDGDRKRKQD